MKLLTPRFALWIAFLIASVIFLAWVRSGMVWITAARKAESDVHMHEIADAIVAYKKNVGTLPRHLSDIIPKYLDVNGEGDFYIEHPQTTSLKPPDYLASSPQTTEAFLPYLYIPLKGNHFVVAERPGFWKDGTIGYVLSGEPSTSLGSGTVTESPQHRVNVEQFKHLLERGFSD